jgi:uncharacterized membrane protein YhaH (DUF805 family)
MTKRNNIIYWIATLWLSLGMVSTGLVQLLHIKSDNDLAADLNYPDYFLVMLGACKILGVIAILVPRASLLKEWAYAGFVFSMAGAIVSHIVMGAPSRIFPALLLLTLTIVSWYFRPADRKLIAQTL